MQRIHVTIRPLNREDSVLYFPPEAFGPFRVLHQIGAGTLGPVFRAYEPGRDRLVAVKVFRFDLTPEQAEALAAELDALVRANINHPNIASPIAAGLDHATAFLAQEYAVGDSLDVVLRDRGPMPVSDVAALVESLASAIDYAADRGVHHGSLHPRDIVLAPDAARITGFGIAAALSSAGLKPPARPQYSRPDLASDVYSLGAIAFEAATGRRASAENLKNFEEEHGTGLCAAFNLALAANPAARRATRARDFAAMLQGASGLEAAAYDEANTPQEEGTTPNLRSAAADASMNDLDLRIDPPVDLMALPDAPADLIDRSSPAPFLALSAQPFPSLASGTGAELETESRRWPIVAIFLGFAIATALAVGFLLRAPRPVPTTRPAAGVEETVVDLPASAPETSDSPTGKPAAATAPANRAELRRDRPAPAPTPSRPASGAVRGAQTGSVLIRSTPADADVLVNGKPRGKTPLVLRDLPLGSYKIEIAREGYATEERTMQLTVRRPTTSTTINLRSTTARGASASTAGGSPDTPAQKTGPGGLTVQSRPAGARVFVNNRLAGSTPIAIPGVPAGHATVRIEMDGYQPWMTTVSIGAGEQLRVAASLERQ